MKVFSASEEFSKPSRCCRPCDLIFRMRIGRQGRACVALAALYTTYPRSWSTTGVEWNTTPRGKADMFWIQIMRLPPARWRSFAWYDDLKGFGLGSEVFPRDRSPSGLLLGPHRLYRLHPTCSSYHHPRHVRLSFLDRRLPPEGPPDLPKD